MEHGDEAPSLHYVGPDGKPIDVRPFYRVWVVTAAVVVVYLVGELAGRQLHGFRLGVVEGTLLPALALGTGYGWAWWQDRRHRHASRAFWVHSIARFKRRLTIASVSASVVFLLALVVAGVERNAHSAGVATALLFGDLFVLAVLGDIARARRRRRL